MIVFMFYAVTSVNVMDIKVTSASRKHDVGIAQEPTRPGIVKIGRNPRLCAVPTARLTLLTVRSVIMRLIRPNAHTSVKTKR